MTTTKKWWEEDEGRKMAVGARNTVLLMAQDIIKDMWPGDEGSTPIVDWSHLNAKKLSERVGEYGEGRFISKDLCADRPFHAAVFLALSTLSQDSVRDAARASGALSVRALACLVSGVKDLVELLNTLGPVATTIRNGYHAYVMSEDGERLMLIERPSTLKERQEKGDVGWTDDDTPPDDRDAAEEAALARLTEKLGGLIT